MVMDGSPEFPGESNDDLRANGVHTNNFGPNTSDESDIEDGGAYDGYEPLPMADNGEEYSGAANNDVEIMEEDIPSSEYVDPNFPQIDSVEREVTREIWNEPRPQELLNIELDSARTQQIMSAMAAITLPTIAIPGWAQGVPEESWKQDLLDRIRQHSSKSSNSNDSINKIAPAD